MGDISHQVCDKVLLELKEQGITRKDLSKALGITYNQMCNILNKRCALTIDRLYDIARILDIPVATLMV